MQKAHDTFVEAEGDLDKAIKALETAQKKENSKAVDEMLNAPAARPTSSWPPIRSTRPAPMKRSTRTAKSAAR